MTIVGGINTGEGNYPVYWSDPSAPYNKLPVIETETETGGGGANGVNNLGQVVGYVIYQTDKPAYWSSVSAEPQLLNLAGGEKGAALGINSLGQITGTLTYAGVDVDTPVYWASKDASPKALEYQSGGGTSGDAAGINSFGQIVGAVTYAGVLEPVYWTNPSASPKVLEYRSGGGTSGTATGINSFGQIVGSVVYAGLVIPVYWASKDASPKVLEYQSGGGTSGVAAGINSFGQIVGAVVYAGVLRPVYWASVDASPKQLDLTGADTSFNYFAFGISDPPPISNICFPAGTPVKTDQGEVAIDNLVPGKHTLNQRAIRQITQTTTFDPYLIRINKNAIHNNYPSATTVMSKDHKIEFEGQLVPAYRFLDYSDQVKKIPYKGELLYNVLLADGYGKMLVNNLICETLHPENRVAKLFL